MTLLYGFLIAVVLLGCIFVAHSRSPEVGFDVETGIYGGMAVWNLATAFAAARHDDMPGAASSAVTAGLMGWLAWRAWRKRPPRKRRPSRVAARVRDLGHRLTITPAGSHA